ncbi:MAG TPA: helix-turn-helix domain-containing protein [Gemmatimonadaceae bacterium]|nr:helix-turn-helix domain-containing protein [Gemmatimonadaceae bacterium]
MQFATPTVPAIAAFRGLRAEILLALKTAQPLTAKELARRFAVTPNALRRHLKELEALGLVRHDREVRGVGGPTYAFTLSDAGEALFPRAYESVLLDAIEAVREMSGSDGVVRILERRWAAAVRDAVPELNGLPLRERAERLAELLTADGYMAEAEAHSPTEITIRQHNCAIHAVAQRVPEVCEAEARFLSGALGASVTRESHILEGCNSCTYTVCAPHTADERTAAAGTATGAGGSRGWHHTDEENA